MGVVGRWSYYRQNISQVLTPPETHTHMAKANLSAMGVEELMELRQARAHLSAGFPDVA
jgi:hypothetical protein